MLFYGPPSCDNVRLWKGKSMLTDTIAYRILWRMKVTANVPDALMNEVRHFAGKGTITESLVVALEEWIALKHIKELNEEILQTPMEFKEEYSATAIRELNRQA
jgi:hypothetical protein